MILPTLTDLENLQFFASLLLGIAAVLYVLGYKLPNWLMDRFVAKFWRRANVVSIEERRRQLNACCVTRK